MKINIFPKVDNTAFLWILFFSFLFINQLFSQVSGCTDPLASNYNQNALVNNGSCIYPNTNVAPLLSYNLNSFINESSGLILWNNYLWTHNDDTDNSIYALDTNNGNMVRNYSLLHSINNDWEEISQDSNYIYIGDFGNNSNGNRTDLKILRISKNALLQNVMLIDTISFVYSNQINFTASGPNKTDFDCEAFIVTNDSIYLFTKQWISNKTSVYALPKLPGNYTANYKLTYDAQGLITGAVYLPGKNILSLCGYNSLLQPFVYLFYGFESTDFFAANKRKINVSLPFHQVEGITTDNGYKYYLSNEAFNKLPFVNTMQKLHIFDFSPYLQTYLSAIDPKEENKFSIFPVPTKDVIHVQAARQFFPKKYEIINLMGHTMSSGTVTPENPFIDTDNLPDTTYLLRFGKQSSGTIKFVKTH